MNPNYLHSALRDLDATGSAGFEGLVRDLLAEVTGQGFRLMKSGPQGGVDVLGDTTGSGLVVGAEGKHYGAATSLPLDALKSKLRDAAGQFPAMDIWVLATTRAVSAGDVRELEKIAEGLGLDALVLDWDADATTPPPLAVLCAAAPVAAARLGAHAPLHRNLDEIRAHAAFGPELARLRERLTSPLVGYGAARAQLHAWLRRQMTDPAMARLAFDSTANLEQLGVKRVPRPAVSTQLSAWWTNPTQTPAALVGREGVGKTWALLDWWLREAEQTADFPLTVVLAARDVDTSQGPDLVARALFRATQVRDPVFWRRRLDRWRAASGGPALLVIIDGLNQNWAFNDWSELCLSLAAGDWAGRIAVALTCRPDHWNERLKQLGDLAPPPVAVQVDAFDDTELDAMLSAYGTGRDDFDASLLPLLRVARLCRIGIERREELAQSGDITPERLIYEDWRRRSHGAQKALSHDEFRTFVAQLGGRWRKRLDERPLTRAELLARLSQDSGRPTAEFEGVLGEVIDGGWLTPAGQRHHFKVDRDRLPHALALDLVEELVGVATFEEAADRITAIFEPLQGLDTAVTILRCAATFAILDERLTRDTRRAVLAQWLGAQNFSPDDFQAFWRLIGWDPHLVLDTTEALWFGARPSGREDEVLVKGLSNAFKWPEVAAAVEARLTTWFSRYWLDPLQGEILGQVDEDESAVERRGQTALRAETWATEARALNLGFEVTLTAPDQQAWGSYRAVELISWLPLAPLVRPLTAWAVTRAILGAFRQEDKMSWALRWNPSDPVEAERAVIAAATRLHEAGGEIAGEASRVMLAALATPAARLTHDQRFPPPGPAPIDPPIEWPLVKALAWGRCADKPLEAVIALRADPADADLELAPDQAQALSDLARRLEDRHLVAGPDADGGLETGRLALARWASADRTALERRRFRAAITPPPPEGIRGFLMRWANRVGLGARQSPKPADEVLKRLPGALLLLPDPELVPWRAHAAAERTRGAWDDRLQAVALAGRPASEQIAALRQRPADMVVPKWLKKLLNAKLEAADWAGLEDDLSADAPQAQLLFWLNFLLDAPIDGLPPAWPPLVNLFTHPDAAIRGAAFQVAWRAEDSAAATALHLTGWTWQEGQASDEAGYGTLLMTLCPAASAIDLSARVHPQALGGLAKRHPDQPHYLHTFADYVRDELEYLRTARERSYPRYLLNGAVGWERLVEVRGADLRSWLQPFVDNTGNDLVHHFFMAESFPLMEALEAYDTIEPGTLAEVVTRVLEAGPRWSMRLGSLYQRAVEMPGPAGEAARQIALDEANTDRKLFDAAIGLQKSGQTDWLIPFIRAELTDPGAGRVARAMTLAGFLDNVPEADALWSNELATPPATGWLSDVHHSARARYLRNVWAHHWGRRFSHSTSADEAFVSHELLVASCDARFYQRGRPSPEDMAAWDGRWRDHWRLRWSAVEEAAKANAKALETSFLATELPLQRQRPRQR